MKNVFGKIAVVAGLFMVSLSSCKKEETFTGKPDAYTGVEISKVTSTSSSVTVDGIIGKNLVPTDVVAKIVISKQDEADKKVALYTYTNVALSSTASPLNTKLVGPYGKDANIVYSFSKTLTLAELGTGVKTTKATTVTIDIYDATKVIASVEMKTADWSVKLLTAK
jgi:hypothetical protein